VNDEGFIVEIGDLLIAPGTLLYAAPAPVASPADQGAEFWKRMVSCLAGIIQDAAPIVGKEPGEESAEEIGRLLKQRASVSPAALTVTDAMVYAFHRATTDGPLGEADFNEIHDALAAALLAAQPAAQTYHDTTDCDECGHIGITVGANCPRCGKVAKPAEPAREDRQRIEAEEDDKRCEEGEREMELGADRQGVALSDDHVSIPRDLIGAACAAIDKKRDAPNVLAELRRYTTGDLSRASSSQGVALSVEIPEDVRNWHTAWQAHIDATATYNARVAFARANEGERIGSISCQAEYELVHDAKNKVMRTLPELFAGISAMLAAAEAPNGEIGDA